MAEQGQGASTVSAPLVALGSRGPRGVALAPAPAVVQRPYLVDRERHPFVALSIDALASVGVDVSAATIRELLVDPPAVLHIHWPDHELVRGLRGRLRAVGLLAAVQRSRRRGGRLVYTAHNIAPHGDLGSRFDRFFLDRFDTLVDELIVMSRAGVDELLATRPGLKSARRHHVRHGDFSGLIDTATDRNEAKRSLGRSPDRQLVVFAGQIRGYKGVPDLLRAAADVDVDVLVAGQCLDAELRDEVEGLAAVSPRATVRYEFLTNRALSTHLHAADLVALPYRRVLNSGAALLALGAARRVMLPHTPTFDELADEVGPAWVPRYDGRLDAGRLADILALGDPPERPDLSLYSWPLIAETLRAVYAGTPPTTPLSSKVR